VGFARQHQIHQFKKKAGVWSMLFLEYFCCKTWVVRLRPGFETQQPYGDGIGASNFLSSWFLFSVCWTRTQSLEADFCLYSTSFGCPGFYSAWRYGTVPASSDAVLFLFAFAFFSNPSRPASHRSGLGVWEPCRSSRASLHALLL